MDDICNTKRWYAITVKHQHERLAAVALEMKGWEALAPLYCAKRQWSDRVQVPEVSNFALLLIQSERFGTSMGTSLRVHSDNLRTKRRMIAEEAAAKIALKLLFPLIFFIFPVLMIVLVGPAGIQIGRAMSSLTGS